MFAANSEFKKLLLAISLKNLTKLRSIYKKIDRMRFFR